MPVRKHGRHRTPEYIAWQAMKQRCHDPNHASHEFYRARGIVVCDRWRVSFAAFFADVGPMPCPGMTLDRLDPSRGYTPGNVGWASRETQNRHRAGNRMVTLGGETHCVSVWAARFGISQRLIVKRLNRGMSPEAALTRPVRRRNAVDTRSPRAVLYSLWYAMRNRCHNPAHGDYPAYGGRGITVCDRWLEPDGFAAFARDMGERPSRDHSLDRIDPDGPYSPENCRWATRLEQARNTRRNRKLAFGGERLTLSEWAARTGLPARLIGQRLGRGWSIRRALGY